MWRTGIINKDARPSLFFSFSSNHKPKQWALRGHSGTRTNGKRCLAPLLPPHSLRCWLQLADAADRRCQRSRQLSSSYSIPSQRSGRGEYFCRENFRQRPSPTSFRWYSTWRTKTTKKKKNQKPHLKFLFAFQTLFLEILIINEWWMLTQEPAAS